MDNQIKDFVNLGIGAIKQITEQGEELLKNAESKINELTEAGKGVKTETAEKVRAYADDAIKAVNELQAKAEEIAENLKSQVEGLNLGQKEEAKAASKVTKKETAQAVA